jgi:putative Holliday junction resolvase
MMIEKTFRVLGVDPGDKRIGVAISDPTQTIATPYGVIEHSSRQGDARAILAIGEENQIGLVLIGQALNWDGEISPQGKKAARLAEEIQSLSDIPVKLWDEYGSTKIARRSRQTMNLPKKKRKGHHDQIAAVVILQSYLDSLTGLEEA